jgi:hypothetical protein
MTTRGPAGAASRRIAQVVGKHLDRHLFGLFAQAREQVALQRQAELDAPGPGHALAQQVVRGAASVAPAQVQRDAPFGKARLAGRGLCGLQQLHVQHFERAPAEHGQRAVRGHAADRLCIVEIVAELGDLGVVFILALDLAAREHAFVPKPGAQGLHERRVFGPAFAQDVAHAVEHRRHAGKIRPRFAVFEQLGRAQKGLRGHRRVARRVGPEQVCERLEPAFARDLPLGAALLLERQVQVFELLLGRRGGDRGAQRVGELALRVYALEHGARRSASSRR